MEMPGRTDAFRSELCERAAGKQRCLDWEPAEDEREDNLQNKSDQEVRDRVNADRDAFEDFRGCLVLTETCKQTDEVADDPCKQRGGQGQTEGVRQVTTDNRGNRLRIAHQRRAKVKL